MHYIKCKLYFSNVFKISVLCSLVSGSKREALRPCLEDICVRYEESSKQRNVVFIVCFFVHWKYCIGILYYVTVSVLKVCSEVSLGIDVLLRKKNSESFCKHYCSTINRQLLAI